MKISFLLATFYLEDVELLDDAIDLVNIHRPGAFLGSSKQPQQIEEDIVVVPGDSAPPEAV
jgi:hypothetical protein